MSTPKVDTDAILKASLAAAEIISGMGYTGTHGSIHLLKLNTQTNTITAILHNLIAWQISVLDTRWLFHPKGGGTPDLTNDAGQGIQVKVTSDQHIKGNRVSSGEGFYVTIGYTRDLYTVVIKWVLSGNLRPDDWNKPAGTQLAILSKEAKMRMKQLYP